MGLKAKACVKGCGWCCQYQNLPLPTNDFFTLKKMIELYRTRGNKVYIDPTDKIWYALIYSPCVHYDTETTLCGIHESKPELCAKWVCHDPGRMHEYYQQLIKEGEEYCE